MFPQLFGQSVDCISQVLGNGISYNLKKRKISLNARLAKENKNTGFFYLLNGRTKAVKMMQDKENQADASMGCNKLIGIMKNVLCLC